MLNVDTLARHSAICWERLGDKLFTEARMCSAVREEYAADNLFVAAARARFEASYCSTRADRATGRY